MSLVIRPGRTRLQITEQVTHLVLEYKTNLPAFFSFFDFLLAIFCFSPFDIICFDKKKTRYGSRQKFGCSHSETKFVPFQMLAAYLVLFG
jgi:hypothetical protein